MNEHKLFGSCFNKPLDSLNKLRVTQRFIYLAFKYFPFPAFRQGPNAHSLLHFCSEDYRVGVVYKPFAHEVFRRLAA